jgi:hypothetical protein
VGTYIVLSRLTAEGAKTIKDHAERITAVNHEVDQLGTKVQAQYALLGTAYAMPSTTEKREASMQPTPSPSGTNPTPTPLPAQLGPGFTSQTAQVNGIRVHYVIGGKGLPVVLLHGWSESW